jgi:hypothetical protein
MPTAAATDWRSILLGFAAALTAFALLSLSAPFADKYLLAGMAGAAAVAAVLLAVRVKSPADTSAEHSSAH